MSVLQRARFIHIVLLLGAAGGIVALEAWHGPTLLSLSAGHGIETGDLVALPLLVLAVAVARGQTAERVQWSWAAPASAVTLGFLLLFAGVVPNAGAAKAGGGPLVPSGGGTLDGSVRLISGTTPFPVDRWSDVAVTYDGSTLRLYVNGREVSSQTTTGTIQTPSNPLWIGGNRPYGENFHGLIDESRVYDHALSENEIRRDMAMPVAPAAGLVAAYAFDAGSGATAADASGNHNTGEIRGATWAPGRYGNALRFDGDAAVVRVPASPSLNLTRAMTLSAWIRPIEPQSGWRTIVQRQTDAYILAASSDRQNSVGLIDDVRAGLVVAAAAWLCVMITRSPWSATRRRSWWLPVALFALGSLADAAFAPSGTLIGAALVALWLAATAPDLVARVSFLVSAALCFGLTIGSLANIAGLEATLGRSDGATARTVALGGLFALVGLMKVAAAPRPRRSNVAAPHASHGP